MGLFDRFMEVKYCPICKKEISIANNLKKFDFNIQSFNPFNGFGHIVLLDKEVICKECASKSSPYFYLKDKTLPEFRNHLHQREENQEKHYIFHATKELGEYEKIIIDETKNAFFVSGYNDLNPDIIQGYQIKRIRKLRSKNREEIQYETSNGYKSYNPIQYKYIYEFKLKIELDHPYIDSIFVNIQKEPLIFENPYVDGRKPGLFYPKYPTYTVNEMNEYEYVKYVNMLEEMENALLKIKNPKQHSTVQYIVCPWCQSMSKQKIYENCKCCGGPLHSK